MILDATTFLDCGLPTSNDISTQEVEFGIRSVELYIVKPILGAETYANIVEDPVTYADAIDGTNTVAGLKTAIEHLVYAYLLWDRSRLTRYTSVIKNDEHSTEPKPEDLYQICKAHWEIGIAFLNEICEFLQIPAPNHPLNNLIFGELTLTI
jgi:hypothetical protein